MSISTQFEDILFLRKIEQLGLKPMWDYILRTNRGNGNGYHNTKHMFDAGKNGWKIWNVEVGDESYACDTPEYRLVDVITALLWHDYDHSGGHQPDVENIEDACNAFDHWCSLDEFQDIVKRHNYSGANANCVKRLIRITEFPFIHEPRYIAEKIVRDSDLLYSFKDEAGPILHGLYSELSAAGKLPEDMKFAQIVEGQTKFHNEVQLFTQTGVILHTLLVAEVIREQTAYARKVTQLEKT